MSRPSRILTCTDFSDASLGALRRAAALARNTGADVHLVHVINPSTFIPPQAFVQFADDTIMEITKSLEAKLGQTRDDVFAGLGPARVTCAVLSHPSAASAITEYAEEHGVDTIVVGSHGRTGLDRWLIGSVAEKVVRHAKCDVLVVRGRHEG